MKRDLMIPALLALTVHGLLAFIPADFRIRASPPPPAPLRISFVHREPLTPTPAPVTPRKVSPQILQRKPVKIHKKVVHQRPSLRQKKITLPEKKPLKVPVRKKAAPRNPLHTSKKAVQPDRKARRTGDRAKIKPKHLSEVSDRPKPSRPKAKPPVKTKRESLAAESTQQFHEDRRVSRQHVQEKSRNSFDSDEFRQTSALRPSREDKKSAPVRTMAIPQYKRNRPPSYPRVARLRGQEGTCIVRVMVLPDGTVGDVALVRSSGHDVLDKAALQAVKTWRFTAGTQDGKPVAMRVQVPITFRLK